MLNSTVVNLLMEYNPVINSHKICDMLNIHMALEIHGDFVIKIGKEKRKPLPDKNDVLKLHLLSVAS